MEELKAKCKKLGLSRYSHLNKAGLVSFLEGMRVVRYTFTVRRSSRFVNDRLLQGHLMMSDYNLSLGLIVANCLLMASRCLSLERCRCLEGSAELWIDRTTFTDDLDGAQNTVLL